jgi:hypothetical protein
MPSNIYTARFFNKDPGLSCRFLNISVTRLLQDVNCYGFSTSIKSLYTRLTSCSWRVYAAAARVSNNEALANMIAFRILVFSFKS